MVSSANPSTIRLKSSSGQSEQTGRKRVVRSRTMAARRDAGSVCGCPSSICAAGAGGADRSQSQHDPCLSLLDPPSTDSPGPAANPRRGGDYFVVISATQTLLCLSAVAKYKRLASTSKSWRWEGRDRSPRRALSRGPSGDQAGVHVRLHGRRGSTSGDCRERREVGAETAHS